MPTPMHQFCAVGLLVVCISVPVWLLVASGAGTLSALNDETVLIDARLQSLRSRAPNMQSLEGSMRSLQNDPLASRGQFMAESATEATEELTKFLGKLLPLPSGESKVSGLPAMHEGDYVAVRARYSRTVAPNEFTRVVEAFGAAVPMLFVDELQAHRSSRGDGTSEAIEVTAVIRAYADVGKSSP